MCYSSTKHRAFRCSEAVYKHIIRNNEQKGKVGEEETCHEGICFRARQQELSRELWWSWYSASSVSFSRLHPFTAMLLNQVCPKQGLQIPDRWVPRDSRWQISEENISNWSSCQVDYLSLKHYHAILFHISIALLLVFLKWFNNLAACMAEKNFLD